MCLLTSIIKFNKNPITNIININHRNCDERKPNANVIKYNKPTYSGKIYTKNTKHKPLKPLVIINPIFQPFKSIGKFI